MRIIVITQIRTSLGYGINLLVPTLIVLIFFLKHVSENKLVFFPSVILFRWILFSVDLFKRFLFLILLCDLYSDIIVSVYLQTPCTVHISPSPLYYVFKLPCLVIRVVRSILFDFQARRSEITIPAPSCFTTVFHCTIPTQHMLNTLRAPFALYTSKQIISQYTMVFTIKYGVEFIFELCFC